MKWSPQQDAALLKFKRWWDAGKEGNLFHIFGFAGTGKTTLAIELATSIGGNVAYAAYTGKAASVMRSKDCHGSTTIHQLIYTTQQQSKLRLVELERKKMEATEPEEVERLEAEIKKERENLLRPSFTLNEDSRAKKVDLIIIDEVSMVDERVGRDLMSFNVPILVLGDPAQLPPVKGSGFFMTGEPEVTLTEVHRTALDNPVLHLATRIREGGVIAIGDYGESRVISRAKLEQGASLEYDQVIVGRNRTRVGANMSIRSQLGFEGDIPQVQDKLICLKNNHQLGIMNGTLYRVLEAQQDSGYEILMRLESEDNNAEVEVEAYPQPFKGEEVPRWSFEGLEEFAYGYAVTCHKAQGSEWPNVFIVDESNVFRSDARKWLYTAITRASNKVMVVR